MASTINELSNSQSIFQMNFVLGGPPTNPDLSNKFTAHWDISPVQLQIGRCQGFGTTYRKGDETLKANLGYHTLLFLFLTSA